MTIKRAIIVSAAIMLAGVFGASTSPAVAAPKPPLTITYSDYIVGGASETHVTGVNNTGVKAGYYVDSSGTHGFTYDGTNFVRIDVTGATSTIVTSINDDATVVGAYWTGDGVEHGFIDEAGVISTFDDPNLVTTGATSYGTVATGINKTGVVVGYSFTVGPDTFTYPDGGTVAVTHYHGFIRSSLGTFSVYDAPGATATGAPQVGTRLFGINSAGDMVGAYTYLKSLRGDPMNAGFLVSGKKFTRIVDPSSDIATNSCGYHEPHGINDAGVIVGYSGNGCGGVVQDAWLLLKGKFTHLAYYQSATDYGQWTVASSINNNGIIGGTWGTGIGGVHGFTATTQ
jgi:hypothetical protein